MKLDVSTTVFFVKDSTQVWNCVEERFMIMLVPKRHGKLLVTTFSGLCNEGFPALTYFSCFEALAMLPEVLDFWLRTDSRDLR
jgi:hypothetical protein